MARIAAYLVLSLGGDVEWPELLDALVRDERGRGDKFWRSAAAGALEFPPFPVAGPCRRHDCAAPGAEERRQAALAASEAVDLAAGFDIAQSASWDAEKLAAWRASRDVANAAYDAVFAARADLVRCNNPSHRTEDALQGVAEIRDAGRVIWRAPVQWAHGGIAKDAAASLWEAAGLNERRRQRIAVASRHGSMAGEMSRRWGLAKDAATAAGGGGSVWDRLRQSQALQGEETVR